ncbi:phosphoenolpyruvate--protein phosphotransferase [Loigolactobacillus coryniformis]|jgi:phosphotransferase system enzyme I (PtsI)|uniref:Phosphoenolpyruvate-protein phosphotransferase n=3 Tax=Loigolactobacillus coryniformis TaxID=1610 RepID=J3JCG8_9LACO|nr:phosphoenolpyruvate--protein phosphotransferase [Loigolactobacillus coryniformis]MDT3391549.1 phosphoenolpyruvate--protein phosphotransferase [Bacillota bacterium]RRG02217.1 MAG: phosphoenolpyruvate--protein phosphotransferase [Lactobacillus sp.]ATO42969.1 phosphoenolpyruvate--protein phosphotransferase [Loigolactobacillus coryniformis subsp. torquens DSM 20004 = KCTC 3535]EJN56594.1 Phosphoenolpyruvate-protein phosphotransferase (Phosphotransferase system, enzyme I) [Loigolactobacillus cory
MTEMLKGIAASDGIARAKAYLLVQPDLSFSKKSIDSVDGEVARLQAAVTASTEELQKIRDIAVKSLGEEEAQVFDAHMMILADPEFVGAVETGIKNDKTNAEQVLHDVSTQFVEMFEAMTDNPYMQERAADIRDVTKRVMSHLLGVTLPNPALIDEEVVIIAHDLTPSDTAQLNRKYVKGFITDLGGRTSHSAIMARSLEIPAIVGTEKATEVVNEDQMVIVDGNTGDALLDPSDADIAKYDQAAKDFAAQKAEWEKLKNERTVTKDGKNFITAANIGTPDDVVGATDNGAEAVGLFRSEFLYMDSAELPTEDEQFEAYKKALEGMNGNQVVVRTMDIGGDKHLPYLPLPEEMNPFLGYRAIRISLDRQDIFRTQLRALLRASNYGNLAIMFPMIATVSEFKQARAIYDEERAKLVKAGTPVADKIEVGMMMEIPAAAVIADKLAKYADFFSIGTNDLIQYSMAADRGNEHVSYLYQPYNPSILRLVKRIIDAAHAEGKWAGMCGEAAGDPIMVPLLLGMGLDEYSMSATSILKIRSLMRQLDTNDMKALADKALTDAETNEDVIALVKSVTQA